MGAETIVSAIKDVLLKLQLSLANLSCPCYCANCQKRILCEVIYYANCPMRREQRDEINIFVRIGCRTDTDI